jgi:hypothetical protein
MITKRGAAFIPGLKTGVFPLHLFNQRDKNTPNAYQLEIMPEYRFKQYIY